MGGLELSSNRTNTLHDICLERQRVKQYTDGSVDGSVNVEVDEDLKGAPEGAQINITYSRGTSGLTVSASPSPEHLISGFRSAVERYF